MINNLTALFSCFARYYHTENSNIKIYNDRYAKNMLTKKEYEEISKTLEESIKYFNPDYYGIEPLKWIVNNNLAPSILARSKYSEIHLKNEMKLGLKQYVIFASGYDTSAFKVNKKIKVFELDKPEIIDDKLKRVKKAKLDLDNITYIKADFNYDWIDSLLNSGFNQNEKTLFSMLGISYYLDKKIFGDVIYKISKIIPKGSAILFDYPNKNETHKELINKALASLAGEEMKSNYSYEDIEKIASKADMHIYEHLNHKDVDNMFFYDYNTVNPNDRIHAPKGISYVLLVKKDHK